MYKYLIVCILLSPVVSAQSYDHMNIFDDEIQRALAMKRGGTVLLGISLSAIGAGLTLYTIDELVQTSNATTQRVLNYGMVGSFAAAGIMLIPALVLFFVGDRRHEETIQRAYEYIRISE